MDPSEDTKNKTGPEEELIDKLFKAVMKNKWEEVVTIYKNDSTAHEAKLITRSEDTALHIAVSNGRTTRVAELLETINENVLMRMKNAKGNTPLHLAASLGNLKICAKMVSKNREVMANLLAVRNEEGETPIFLAACHGHDDVFFYLTQNILHVEIKEEYLRRNNGDTILHVTISGEYFNMAMKIIDDYQYLVDAMNVDGLSPLHVLANKPNAFKSSTQLRTFDRFIYYCLYVDLNIIVKKKLGASEKKKIEKYRRHIGGEDIDIGEHYPKNYETCMNFFNFLLKKLFRAIIGRTSNSGNNEDEENPLGLAKGQEKIEDTTGEKKDSKQTSSFKQYCFEEVKMDDNRERLFPPNYDTLVLLSQFVLKVFLVILGVGIWRINELQRKKELHMRAKLVMEKLVEYTKLYISYGNTGSEPDRRKAQEIPDFNPAEVTEKEINSQDKDAEQKNVVLLPIENRQPHVYKFLTKKENIPIDIVFWHVDDQEKKGKGQTPILIAAKAGITEMVEKIFEEFPVAIQDEDAEQKNVALLAIENRQPHVYMFLLKKENIPTDSVFRHVDNQGNSALHLAATQCKEYRPWLISGSALQMQWELKWFQFVKNSMPPNYFRKYNEKKEKPDEVFASTHKDLIKDGSEWLGKTSESCSVVAALVATVAFATSSTVPGGINEDKGTPTLEDEPAFNAFAISSLAALCFSITALVFFLSILTSRYQVKDFALDLPRKLLLGLTSLFASIASMLVSFCAGHLFVLNGQLRYVAYPLYAFLCLPITFFAFAQLSLYFDLLLSIFKKVPQRSYEVLAN
ncbi:uncharacterized protein LOC21401695 isoform X2 [Morus notabilis]|uniref:uncharacterized protein LOC21401695 isoform X2 n=1 Tax=Morus notabilis TaxID=981085 RepID=UPI000CED4506|nr:uncharacterized protein LOC21401695 isoform X2 [Morus notabilis]